MTQPSAQSGPQGTGQARQPGAVPRQAGAIPGEQQPRQEEADYRQRGQEQREDQALRAAIQATWLAALVTAIGVFAVGLMLLVWPNATLNVAAFLIGASLLVAGVVRLYRGFTAADESAGMRAAGVLLGLLAGFAGLYLLKHHSVTIFLLAFLTGAYWTMHGIADLAVAATAPRGMPGRGFTTAAGVFSVAAGLVVLFWPAISLVLLITILGAWLMLYGVVLAGYAFQLRRGVAPGTWPRMA